LPDLVATNVQPGTNPTTTIKAVARSKRICTLTSPLSQVFYLPTSIHFLNFAFLQSFFGCAQRKERKKERKKKEREAFPFSIFKMRARDAWSIDDENSF
jgi:hypothetical protein